MATRYTDVDVMILKRWDEVKALREAFDDLVDRMRDVVETVAQRVDAVAREKGLSSDFDPKRPSIWFWKREWENRKHEPGVYIELFDFVPADYGKDVEEHPSLWVMTDEFSRLRMKESSDEFARLLKAEMSTGLVAKWTHDAADSESEPFGREYVDVSESSRVDL